MCSEYKLDLRDGITQKKIGTPVKGQWCEHLQSFELNAYIWGNNRFNNRKWICPICPSDKPVILKRNEFFEKLLQKVNENETNCSIN